MSASFPKHSLVGVLPNNVSIAEPSQPHRGRGFFARLADAVTGFGRRETVLNELASLSSRELADIGLSRGDIPRVFDRSFAAEYNARR